MPTHPDTGVYQLRIALIDARPPIWRRVMVPGGWSLGALHYVIQVTMGWTNSHLHQFIIGDDYISLYPEEGVTTRDATKVALAEIALKPKTKFGYEYDFGDGWLHEVLVEKILSPSDAKEAAKRAVCIDGKRACPPEDCGGVHGYEHLLSIITDPKNPEHDEMSEWLEDTRPGFDPNAFDLDEVNRRLKLIKPTVLKAEANIKLFV